MSVDFDVRWQQGMDFSQEELLLWIMDSSYKHTAFYFTTR